MTICHSSDPTTVFPEDLRPSVGGVLLPTLSRRVVLCRGWSRQDAVRPGGARSKDESHIVAELSGLSPVGDWLNTSPPAVARLGAASI
jgi:hypothetical protein